VITDELRRSVASRAADLRLRLNDPAVDPVAAAVEANRLFEDAVDEAHTRWITLELGGYRDLVAVQPLHQVLRVPHGSRLATHVAAYRTQHGVQTAVAAHHPFSHFFVEPIAELVATRDRVRRSGGTSELELQFGPQAGVPNYPASGAFPRNVFERVVGGFTAALYLQLGEIAS
jgi:hypothetical protein